MSLTELQIERFSRQIILPEVGGRGQARLLRASLWLADTAEPLAGAARYLAAAGVRSFHLATADPALTAAIASLQPDAVVGHDTDTAADVALAGAVCPPARARFWIRGGAIGARAWIARGGRDSLLCRNCTTGAVMARGDAFAPAALGLAAAQMALAALNYLLGVGVEDAAHMTVFDLSTGEWRDSGDLCVACDGKTD